MTASDRTHQAIALIQADVCRRAHTRLTAPGPRIEDIG